ncbi:MAG TPA: hypothetical protein VIY29_16900 [Ktedonobacteraceae bacterium]
MPEVSQASRLHQPREASQNPTRISSFGWVMVGMLFVLGAINFADKAVLGLSAVPIIKELHLSPTQYGVVSSSLFWLFAISSVLVTALLLLVCGVVFTIFVRPDAATRATRATRATSTLKTPAPALGN